MTFNEELADRVRDALPPDVVEKHMFGGLGFMVEGHLTVALGRDDLMVRLGAVAVAEALTVPGVSPSIMGQRTMADWVLVANESLTEPADLTAWVDQAMAFVQTLPPK
jgi:TfoX/Sxy family transcriptional regulator of competence genes